MRRFPTKAKFILDRSRSNTLSLESFDDILAKIVEQGRLTWNMHKNLVNKRKKVVWDIIYDSQLQGLREDNQHAASTDE